MPEREAKVLDMNDAAVAKDKVGYGNVITQGRTYDVSDRTRAKLIGYGDGLMGASVYHIRIEEGPHTNEDGWIPMEWLKKP